MRNAVSRLLDGRGWTDGELAARAGLDRAHVNQVKNGRAEPTVATALAIARALRVPVAVAFPPGSSVRRRKPCRPAPPQWNATTTAVNTSPNDSAAAFSRSSIQAPTSCRRS
jgi:transcriptional regulator with XRE-family HTH domain